MPSRFSCIPVSIGVPATRRVYSPWPANANGTGASLQLVDPRQDNWRPGNWLAVLPNASATPQWTYVTATGTAPLSYQWRFNGTNLPNNSKYSGVTSARFSLEQVTNADAGRLTEAARRHGMRNLREDGWRKIRMGLTTVAEVMRVTQEF